MCLDVLGKFWSRYKAKSRKKASNSKIFTKDVLCSRVFSTKMNPSFPQTRQYYSVLHTIHWNLINDWKTAPPSPHSLSPIRQSVLLLLLVEELHRLRVPESSLHLPDRRAHIKATPFVNCRAHEVKEEELRSHSSTAVSSWSLTKKDHLSLS